jgi:hypothetical protein
MPSVVFYVLAAVLVLFGGFRINLGRTETAPGRRRYHLLWGILYVIAGLWLIGAQRGWLPVPGLKR